MKTLKLIMSVVAIAAAFALTSCTKETKNQGDPFSNVKEGWTESGNTMQYKTVIHGTKADSYDLYYLFTIKISGETCTSVIWELGCPNAELASEIMTELKKDSEFNEIASMFSVSGRIIKVDLTSLFKDIPVSYIKMTIESMGKQAY